MRKVCVLTGTRAEYGYLRPIIKEIQNHPNLKLSIIVAGMHLSKEFGYTINDIIKDGFMIDEKVEMNPTGDSGFHMSKSIGKGIIKISEALKKINPDIILILGDRTESLAGAIAAAYMNILVAHIHGGDSAHAGKDDSARHAITKFAHIHFPATKKSAERIYKMGEDDWRIFLTGSPSLDTIFNTKLLSEDELKSKFEVNPKNFILVLQHSVTFKGVAEKAEEQIIETLEAIKELKYPSIIIYPNSDEGGRKIISKIKEYEDFDFIKSYKSLPHTDYLSLLKYASVMVGNSSSGIIESSSFKLPVVNIGIRQEGRERANNVIDVNHDCKEIIEGIKKALSSEFKEQLEDCKNPYGNGESALKIVKILKDIDINDKKLIQKKITY